ncbi:sulfite exporter TauE/SafE family protein [Kocuria massiliensis]|uniref:sulfite exporter TauE/SafE family protein n=1 Tax=Kocuria massiliensis TaxID=1926282 RepID=UPI0022B952CB|nr:sulfite exporter TauE/SafE family protein [Kocuria massiliensis]
MTTAALIIIIAAALVAAFVQGATGMGFAMIVTPVVSLLEPSLVPVLILFLMLPLNLYVLARERHAVDWRGASWVSVGRFLGTFLGLWVLVLVNLHQLSLLIGWSTLVAAVIAILAPEFKANRTVLTTVGLVTGITETSTGVGGPPYALAYQHRPGPELRSTVALCFLVGEIISLLVLALGGRVTGADLTATAAVVPAVLVGAFLSRYVHRRLDGPVLRYIVLGFAIVSGIVVILRA